ncbi:DUF551 domain-containing protein [Enterobacter hormaechei]|nr:DUF551 domain-containing protein [Enterobacter hormaechei]
MSTLTKEWLLKTIAELEEERDAVPGVVNEDATMALAAMKLALASLEAEPVTVNDDMAYAFHHALSDSSLGADEAEEIKAGLRAAFANVTAPTAPVSVPDELSREEYKRRFMDEDNFDDTFRGGWNSCRAAMLQGAEPVSQHPELTVWYGSMPETNGKTNWTAILHRKGECLSTGITIEISEYPDRVRYEADRVRHIIGELKEQPDILAYDADAHSGYVKPGNSPAIPDGWVACSERMPEEDGNYWGWWSESKRQGPVWFIKSDLQAQFQSSEITHWMPLPAAPQQKD